MLKPLVLLPLFLTSVYFGGNQPFNIPYSPAAALFGSDGHFVCNAVILTKTNVITSTDCLMRKFDDRYALGCPQDFHVVLGVYSIEPFDVGGLFARRSSTDEAECLQETCPKSDEYGGNLMHHRVSIRSYLLKPEQNEDSLSELVILEMSDNDLLKQLAVGGNYDLTLSPSAKKFNVKVMVYGWGYIRNLGTEMSFYDIQAIEMLLLHQTICVNLYANKFKPDQHLCLMPSTSATLCSGFAGAPIVLDGKLIGIVQGGDIACSSKSPVVGTRLGPFKDYFKL
ncbi:trypsin-like [Toxorhynchites rutilus septentrionalis]|uniref:trypsin-like n=1 Tax=Toxorhynchites rutilus septentrionalis TaxID=329112 RepID=UPI00247AFA96|nr:trypsin-like [Toxorhynchites rutilus septentrionalis]